MKTYRILVVEDDPEWRRSIAGIQHPGCVITCAASVKEAREMIDESFYHAAFVDLRLDKTDALTGKDVLEYLASKRPCCRRFLFTDQLQYAITKGQLQELLVVRRPLIEGIVSKVDITRNPERSFLGMVDDYLVSAIKIGWPDKGRLPARIVRSHDDRRKARANGEKPSGVKASRDELDYLVSSLLGQSAAERLANPGDISEVKLEQLVGGRSSAVVLKGKTRLQSGIEGIWLVFKIDEKSKVVRESTNFSRFVKWTLQTNRRVEMLSHAVGDTLGAVCYSFAHSTPANVTSLEGLVKERKAMARSLIKEIFSQRLEWYANAWKERQGMAEYFDDEHELTQPRQILDAAVNEMADAIDESEHQIRVIRRSTIQFQTSGGKPLWLPHDWLGGPERHAPYLKCIIHGDLNLGNVIVPDMDGQDLSWVFIDYAFTGFGPALMDFVVLHLHVLLTLCEEHGPDRWLEMDVHLLGALYAGEALDIGCRDYCEGLCRVILASMDFTFAAKFREIYSGPGEGRRQFRSQFAIASIQWSIRLLRVKGLGTVQKIRIMIWLTALHKAMEKHARTH